MTVSDLQRSIDFYSRLLGLTVRWRGTTPDGKPAAHVGDERLGGSYLALFQTRTGSPARPTDDYDAVGLNHFGFIVPDLDEARRCLVSMAITPHLEADYEPGRRLYFHDLDGIEVELVQYD